MSSELFLVWLQTSTVGRPPTRKPLSLRSFVYASDSISGQLPYFPMLAARLGSLRLTRKSSSSRRQQSRVSAPLSAEFFRTCWFLGRRQTVGPPQSTCCFSSSEVASLRTEPESPAGIFRTQSPTNSHLFACRTASREGCLFVARSVQLGGDLVARKALTLSAELLIPETQFTAVHPLAQFQALSAVTSQTRCDHCSSTGSSRTFSSSSSMPASSETAQIRTAAGIYPLAKHRVFLLSRLPTSLQCSSSQSTGVCRCENVFRARINCLCSGRVWM